MEVVLPVAVVVAGDEEIRLPLLPVRSARVLVVSVVLEYETLIVNAVAEAAMISVDSEDSEKLLEAGEGSSSGDVEGIAAGVKLRVGVKEVSVGAGEGGGEERIERRRRIEWIWRNSRDRWM